MGRKSTGSVRILKNDKGKLQWHAKWTVSGGKRTKWLPIDPNIPIDDKAAAKSCAARMASDAIRGSIGMDGPSVSSALDLWLDNRRRSVSRTQYEKESLAIRRYVYPSNCDASSFDQDAYESIINAALRDESISVKTRRGHVQTIRKALRESGIYGNAAISARDAIRHAAAQLGGLDALLDAIAGEFDVS